MKFLLAPHVVLQLSDDFTCESMVVLTYRTLQTAVGVFGGEGYTDRMDVLPLMVANAGNSGLAAISSLNCPPIIASELCREHLVRTINLGISYHDMSLSLIRIDTVDMSWKCNNLLHHVYKLW